MSRSNTDSKKGWVLDINLDQPSLSDNTSDADRIIKELTKKTGIKDIDIDYELLKKIPFILRDCNYNITCTFIKYKSKAVLIDIRPVENNKPVCGIAIDLGTTRIVMRLVNLQDSSVLGEATFDNPQIAIGPDVLTRIHFSEKENGLHQLNSLVIEGINKCIIELCEINSLSPDDVLLVTLAGNTAMTHLFLNLDPRWIIREPYIPVINKPGLLHARELNLNTNLHSRIIVFPNIGSYFGGDLIAGILFSKMYMAEETAILVDVGTNAEVVLGNGEWLLACAGAAGPALESGVSKIGMAAQPGAIEKVEYDYGNDDFIISTIDNVKPVGICGSGIIDLAACLFKSGKLDIRGKFSVANCGNRLKEIDEILHYTVIPASESATKKDLTLSQADIDSLIRSKAAMFTILKTITGSIGMEINDLPLFYVAGTFGIYINPKSAITIGMIPDLPLERYKPLGNSSLEGATLALTSIEDAEKITMIRDKITYMELNVNQEFMNRFSAAKFLPHTNRSLFPSVSIPA